MRCEYAYSYNMPFLNLLLSYRNIYYYCYVGWKTAALVFASDHLFFNSYFQFCLQ